MLFFKKNHQFIRITDVLRLATGSLSSNRLRSLLTVMGITIGVFSVVGTMTALIAVRTSISSELAFLGANTFRIGRFPSMMVGGDGWWNYIHRPEISYRQGMRFKELMAAENIPVSIHQNSWGHRIVYQDRRTSPNQGIIGGNEYCLEAFNYKLARGRSILADDLTFNRNVVILGDYPARELFPDRDPIGEEVYLKGHRYVVVGVMEAKGEIFGNGQDDFVFIPLTRFMAEIGEPHANNDVAVIAPSPDAIATVEDMAIGYMRMVRGLDPEDPNDFSIDSNDSLQGSFNKIARIIGSAGLLISLIALITAGVGIMNIMLVSVTERTREIGIRKSIGGRSTDILKQFLIEAVCISEMGAFAGIVLGMLVGNLIAKVMKVSMVFPWNWAVLAVLVCSFIGILFGMYPAWKASRLDPVEALRFE